jgi:hypothetical protein
VAAYVNLVANTHEITFKKGATRKKYREQNVSWMVLKQTFSQLKYFARVFEEQTFFRVVCLEIEAKSFAAKRAGSLVYAPRDAGGLHKMCMPERELCFFRDVIIQSAVSN